MTRRPRLALLLGDPNGIGPEVSVKLLARPDLLALSDVVVFTDRTMLDAGARVAATKLDLARCAPGELRFEAGRASLAALDLISGEAITPGEATEAGGRAALIALETATDAAKRGEVDGIVFAPLNKHAMRLGGLQQEDELRYLQEKFGVNGFVSEFNITGALWTSRVTSHIPLRDVARSITAEGVSAAVRIADRYLKAAGKPTPRIAVAGLNPHAGEGGLFGDEEATVIAPAIVAARGEGIDASGPYAPDTVFMRARNAADHPGEFDVVVAMTHDHGLIPVKYLGVERGVNVTLGLPFVRTSPDHGTAFDIAGRGIANERSLIEAIEFAERLASAN